MLLPAARCVAAEPAADGLAQLNSAIEAVRRLECVEMRSAILRGEPIGPGTGWFHPAQSVYDWK